MRTALISDIHGSLRRLQRVLADIADQGCDRILCLGDLVDGEEQGVEAVRLLRDAGIPMVRGNHDETALYDPNLPEDVREFLRGLPEDRIEGNAIYTHSSPRGKRRKVRDEIEAWNVFEETEWRRIFVGDVHVPFLFGSRSEHRFTPTVYPVVYGVEFPFDADDRYLVCPGAVGYSRDADPRPRYAIYDAVRDTIRFRVFEG